MELAAKSSGPAVELQWVLDDIMAFRGSCEENIEEEINRNIIKSGASLERVDIFLRLGYPQEQCLKEVRHLASRLKKAQLAVNENNMQFCLTPWQAARKTCRLRRCLQRRQKGCL